jgi:hypothetical protein
MCERSDFVHAGIQDRLLQSDVVTIRTKWDRRFRLSISRRERKLKSAIKMLSVVRDFTIPTHDFRARGMECERGQATLHGHPERNHERAVAGQGRRQQARSFGRAGR